METSALPSDSWENCKQAINALSYRKIIEKKHKELFLKYLPKLDIWMRNFTWFWYSLPDTLDKIQFTLDFEENDFAPEDTFWRCLYVFKKFYYRNDIQDIDASFQKQRILRIHVYEMYRIAEWLIRCELHKITDHYTSALKTATQFKFMQNMLADKMPDYVSQCMPKLIDVCSQIETNTVTELTLAKCSDALKMLLENTLTNKQFSFWE